MKGDWDSGASTSRGSSLVHLGWSNENHGDLSSNITAPGLARQGFCKCQHPVEHAMVAWKNVQDYEKIEKGGPAAHTHFLCHKISQEDGKGNQPTPVTVCPCHTSRGAQCDIFHRGLLHLSASTRNEFWFWLQRCHLHICTLSKSNPSNPRVSKTHGYISSKYANVCWFNPISMSFWRFNTVASHAPGAAQPPCSSKHL